MAFHPDFPRSSYSALLPDQRWFPTAEELRSTAYEKLLPPLVAKIRTEVSAWRNEGYAGASPTSISLLRWWFEAEQREDRSVCCREECECGRPKRSGRDDGGSVPNIGYDARR